MGDEGHFVIFPVIFHTLINIKQFVADDNFIHKCNKNLKCKIVNKNGYNLNES